MDNAERKNIIELKNNIGKMRLCQKEAVMRTHRYPETSYKYFHSRLILFLPWRSEDELINGYTTYEEHYNAKKKQIVEENARKYNMDRSDIDEPFNEYIANSPEVSQWIQAGLTENEDIDEFIDDDGNKVKINRTKDDRDRKKMNIPLSLKYKAEALKQTISYEEYRQMMRGVNDEQREIVMQNRKWIKDTIVRGRKGLEPEPFMAFIAGSGGIGKSYCIRMMQRDAIHLFQRCNLFHGEGGYEYNPEDVIALLTAFTGTAAFNINGTTLHAAFQLSTETLSDQRKTTIIASLEKLMQVTIDKVSMVGPDDVNTVNRRCAMIKHRDPSDQYFGKISVLAVDDLYQLPLVKSRNVFKRMKNPKIAPDIVMPIWQKFKLHELTQVMRQKDREFAEILNKARLGKPEVNLFVDRKLKERELHITEDDPNYPTYALHVYAQNVHAYARNEKILNTIQENQYIITAEDKTTDKKIDIEGAKNT